MVVTPGAMLAVPVIAYNIGYQNGLREGLNHPEKYRPVSTTQWVEKETK